MLVPKSKMGKARALVARFKVGLQAQHKQKGGKGATSIKGRQASSSRSLHNRLDVGEETAW